MARLSEFREILGSSRSIYLDVNVFIYHLEDRLPYSELTSLIFDGMDGGKIAGQTSTLSLLELNVKPHQLGQTNRTLSNAALLKNMPGLFIHPLTLEMADRAAQLRAKYRLKTPDAIHLACAIECQCEIMVGNDKDLRRIKEIRYLWLDDFL